MASLDDLSTALRNADAAGDTDAARILAAEITKMREVSTTADVAKSAGIGLVEGAIGLAGIPGDISEYGARGLDLATRGIGRALGMDIAPRPDQPFTGGSGAIKKGIEHFTGEFYKPKTTAGKYARTVGEFLPAAAGGPGGIARRVVQNAVVPAVASEAAGQATEGTAYETPARIGAALLAPSAVTAASRAVTPIPSTPARQAAVRTLADDGVTSLTAGQITGNKRLQYMEDALGNAPGAGGRATRIQGEGMDQFARAVGRRADESGALPDVGTQALGRNFDRHSQIYDDLSARNTLAIDRPFVHDLNTTAREYVELAGQQGAKPVVHNTMANILDIARRNGGNIPGATYQNLRSQVNKAAEKLKTSDPATADAMRGIRRALDNAMGRSISPQDRALWQRTNREYGNQKDIERATGRGGAAGAEAAIEGQVTPGKLRDSINSRNRSANTRRRSDFHDLTESAAAVMAPLPNSGTAQRNLAYALTGGLAGAIGGAAAGFPGMAAAVGGPAATGRMLMSRPMQAYLSNQLIGRTPEHNRTLARLLRAQSASQGSD